MEAETVAFGYLARALIFEQRVRKRTFGYPRHAPSLSRALKSRRGFSFPTIDGAAEMFFGGTSGTAQPCTLDEN
jgi:hypothetical protein